MSLSTLNTFPLPDPKDPPPDLMDWEWEFNSEYDSDPGPELEPPPPSPPPSEASSSTIGGSHQHTIRARIQVLVMLEYGIPQHQITAITHIGKTRLYNLRVQALKHAYNPEVSRIIEVCYVEDASKSRAPKKIF
jgi:hypothetical protein